MSKETTCRPAAIFDQKGFVEKPGWMRIYRFSEFSGEYFSTNEEYLTQYCGLPAHSVLIAPPDEKTGFARVYRHEKGRWEYVPDHRGEVVYRLTTRSPETVTVIGELPPDVTSLQPKTPYDHWDGKQWVTDKAEQHQEEVRRAKASSRQRMDEATCVIAPLQDAVDLDMATEAEKSALLAWKKYRVLLNRVDISTAPNIDWPTPPDEEA